MSIYISLNKIFKTKVFFPSSELDVVVELLHDGCRSDQGKLR